MTKPKLIINAALTGVIPTREQNPHVPITPDEIAGDALACAAAGASIIHLHARDASGQPTWMPDIYRRIIVPIRRKCPQLILCVSTSGRRESEFSKRAAVLDLNGGALPDMASLTTGSMNFIRDVSVNSPQTIQDLARRMMERGIKPELEFFEPGMIHYAKYLERKQLLRGPWYCNLLLGSLGTSPAEMRDLRHMVDSLPPGTVWSAAGVGRFQALVSSAAVELGGHVRIGLEDNLYLDEAGQEPATNVQLVQRAVQMARSAGREPATPEETREMLGLTRVRGV